MRRFSIAFALLAFILLGYAVASQLTARKVEFAEKAYTAEYERRADDGKIHSFTISCDGKGHKCGLGEWSPLQGVNDYTQGIHFMCIKDKKQAVWRDLIWSDSSDDEWSVKHGATVAYVGEKLIDGHLCRGWDMTGKFVAADPRTDSTYFWYDKETGCLVSLSRTEDKRARSAWEYRLRSLSVQPLPEAAFAIPADYEKVRSDLM